MLSRHAFLNRTPSTPATPAAPPPAGGAVLTEQHKHGTFYEFQLWRGLRGGGLKVLHRAGGLRARDQSLLQRHVFIKR